MTLINDPLRLKSEAKRHLSLDQKWIPQGVQPEVEDPMIRLLLVDDEAAVRRGLRMQLELEPDVQVVGEAGDGAAALDLTPRLEPDVVLMDIRMRGMDGIAAVRKLKQLVPTIPVIMLSLHDDEHTRAEATAAGAWGFVGKCEASPRLLQAIRAAAGR